MNAEDLKECPRCMSAKGYYTIRRELTKTFTGWDGDIKSSRVELYEKDVAYCVCCGVTILDELLRLREEK